MSRPGLGLYAVCDGMGGHAAGEIASRVAADAIEAFVQQTEGITSGFTWPFRYNPEWGIDGNRLVSALLLANREITQRVIDEPALRGMATTAVCLLARDSGFGIRDSAKTARHPESRIPNPDPGAMSGSRRARRRQQGVPLARRRWTRSRATIRGSRNRSCWAC